MPEQAKVRFSGRVQGVWFRAFTSEQATAAGLKGWVRNLPDGSVEALFEGTKETIDLVIEKCRQGPPSAQVENIAIEWHESSDEFTNFTIRY
jgi:acylphosphatase